MQPDSSWLVSNSCIKTFDFFKNVIPARFHRFFGPILMISYACLSNTLLLTGENFSVLRDLSSKVLLNEHLASAGFCRPEHLYRTEHLLILKSG